MRKVEKKNSKSPHFAKLCRHVILVFFHWVEWVRTLHILKLLLVWLFFKIVDLSSAQGCASQIYEVDLNHVDLNKNPKIYRELTDVLRNLNPYAV